MTRYEQILELFPLISYEDDRKTNGHMTFIEETDRRSLAPGVTYTQKLYQRGNGKDVWVYITTVAPDAPVKLAVSACPLGTAKLVIDHARDHEDNVLYAMNASYFRFFNHGDLTPHGIQIVQGITTSKPGMSKVQFCTNFFAITKDGTPIISDADAYYDHLEDHLEYAVGGGLKLIQDGKITLHQDPLVAPRTAVAIAEDGTVIFLCADGRSQISAGLSYGDLIDIYTNLGYNIHDLLNLDGGGSTTVVLQEDDGLFAVHNIPSGPPTPDQPAVEPYGDTQARPVADAILIIQ